MVGTLGHTLPAATVERHAQEDLPRWHPGGEERLHRVIAPQPAPVVGIVAAAMERGLEVGALLPPAVEVVGHQVQPVEVRMDRAELHRGEVFTAGSQRDRHRVAPAVAGALGVQLRPHLRQQQGEVGGVFRAIALGVAGDTRVFPVDVDAVEDAGVFQAGREAALDEQLDTRPGEGRAALGGQGHVAEAVGQ
jgi:hypothetical protein